MIPLFSQIYSRRYLQGVVEQLVLELADAEDLLEDVEELLLGHDLLRVDDGLPVGPLSVLLSCRDLMALIRYRILLQN